MSAPGSYLHCFLRCRNSHDIPVPCCKLGRSQQIVEENRKAIFVCPYCGLVSAYYGKDMTARQVRAEPSLFEAKVCCLVSIDIECEVQGCKARKVIYMVQGVGTGTWKEGIVPRDWQFSETALCGDGHKLRFVEGLHPVDHPDLPF